MWDHGETRGCVDRTGRVKYPFMMTETSPPRITAVRRPHTALTASARSRAPHHGGGRDVQPDSESDESSGSPGPADLSDVDLTRSPTPEPRILSVARTAAGSTCGPETLQIVQQSEQVAREKSRLASRRYRQRLHANAEWARLTAGADEGCTAQPKYRPLSDLGSSLRVGKKWPSKELLMHSLREVGEFMGIYDLYFAVNTSATVEARSRSVVPKSGFNFVARLRTTAIAVTGSDETPPNGGFEWVLTVATCLSHRAGISAGTRRPGVSDAKTAYRQKDIASIVKPFLIAEPSLPAESIRKLLQPY